MGGGGGHLSAADRRAARRARANVAPEQANRPAETFAPGALKRSPLARPRCKKWTVHPLSKRLPEALPPSHDSGPAPPQRLKVTA